MSSHRSHEGEVGFDVDVSAVSALRSQAGDPPGRADTATAQGLPEHRFGNHAHARPAHVRAQFRRQLLARASDERLLERSRLGDEQAFQALIERFRPSLLAYCAPIAGHAGAQDAVQQAFISAWQALLRGCEVQFARAWLFTIAKRAALQIRAESSRTDELPALLPGGAVPDDQFELSRRARSALAAVAGLPPLERRALEETSLRGRSGREVASTLGLSETAARQLIFRARARARTAFGALVPVALLGRLRSPAGRAARRTLAVARHSVSDASSFDVGLPLSRLAPVIVSGALIGAPLAAIGLSRTRISRAPARHTSPAHQTHAGRPAHGGFGAARATLARRSSLVGAAPGRTRSSVRAPALPAGQSAPSSAVALGAAAGEEALQGALGRQVPTAAPVTRGPAEEALPILHTLPPLSPASARGTGQAGRAIGQVPLPTVGIPQQLGDVTRAVPAHSVEEALSTAQARLARGAELGAPAPAGH